MITDIFRAYVKSYKSLPLNLFHIQWKFRDERRPRFGVMRGREFLMKDAYSFDVDEASARKAYNRMFVAYLNTFARMGLKAVPMRADTGPIGGDLSHEFIVLAETGESAVFCDKALVEMPAPGADVDWDDLQSIVDQRTALYAATEEMHDEARFDEAQRRQLERARQVAVRHRAHRHEMGIQHRDHARPRERTGEHVAVDLRLAVHPRAGHRRHIPEHRSPRPR
jgi:prolyl-tRNA synthetase